MHWLSAGQPEAHNQAAALLADILASSASGAPPASEVAKLHRLYCPQEPVRCAALQCACACLAHAAGCCLRLQTCALSWEG